MRLLPPAIGAATLGIVLLQLNCGGTGAETASPLPQGAARAAWTQCTYQCDGEFEFTVTPEGDYALKAANGDELHRGALDAGDLKKVIAAIELVASGDLARDPICNAVRRESPLTHTVSLATADMAFEIYRETPTHTCFIEGTEAGARLNAEMRTLIRRYHPYPPARSI